MVEGADTEGPGARVRFLHTADWQLGMTRHFLDEDAQARYTAARIEAIDRIAAVAVEHGCRFVVVCGDVFESNALPARVVVRALEALGRMPVPVFLLPGNHDPLDASSIYTSAVFTDHRPAHVHVLGSSGVHPVLPGVELVAAPWFGKRPGADLVAAALTGLTDGGAVRVVVGHGAVDVLSPDRTDDAVISTPALAEAVRDGVVQVVVLGDRHSLTELDLGSAGPRVFYAGSPEPTDFDSVEKAPGRVLVVDVDRERVRTTAVRVGTWHFTDLQVPMDGAGDVAGLDRLLTALPDRDRTVVRLRMRGTVTAAERADLEDLLDRHRLALAGVSIWEKFTDVAVTVDPTELADRGWVGFVAGAVGDIAARAADPTDPQVTTARDALALLHRLTAPGSERSRA